MKFIPRPIQEEMWHYFFCRNKKAIHGPMGSGKTSLSLHAIAFLQRWIDSPPCLVVAPKYVAQHTWPDDCKKFDNFGGLRIVSITGTLPPKKRLEAVMSDADVYCVNYENLMWLERVWPKDRPIRQCIIDEATKVKGYRRSRGSKQARALFHLIKDTPFVVELTGTPASNGLLDLWGQLWFLDRGRRLETSIGRYEARYFDKVPQEEGSPFLKTVLRPDTMERVSAQISDICFAIPTEKYFDLEEISEHNVPVTLPPKAMKMYDKFEKEMYIELGKGLEAEAVNGAVKTQKCLQLASGAIYVDPELNDTGLGKSVPEFYTIHDEKLDALENIIDEANGESIIVAYHWRHDIARIQKRFKKAVLFGSQNSILSDWNSGKVPLLLAHPASIGHGLNMQDGGRIIVFFSHWWSLEEKAQITERIGPLRQLQSGYKRTVLRYNIVAKGTADERVILAHKHKWGLGKALQDATTKEDIWR